MFDYQRESICQYVESFSERTNDDASGFEVIPRRWVVKRTFAWMGRNRQLAKDFEKIVETSMAYLEVAMIQLMIRR
ncbi:MAG: transposase [Rhodospirillales bacterium]|nr:transposase [Rhodospirillales bacterium]